MRIGILQFNPLLGAVEANAAAITRLVRQKSRLPLDLLVLPELAVTGYAFKTADHIRPFLETRSGPSYQLARQLCHLAQAKMIVLGYPEMDGPHKAYNSALVVGETGLLYHFRKKHLFVTDESWAQEGQSFGLFKTTLLTKNQRQLTIAYGICMDLNPRKCKTTPQSLDHSGSNNIVEAPFDAYEFGHHCVKNKADIIIIPMAWTKNEAEDAEQDSLHAVRYWLARLGPVLQQDRKTLVVFADRTGQEDSVKYQGSSCAVLIDHGECTILGKLDFEEDLLIVEHDIDGH